MLHEQYLLLVRHGETVGNSEQIAHGQTESPLNERGIEQARHTAEKLTEWPRKYHRIYASPLSRALHTAERVAQALTLPLDTHDHLMEGNLGILENVTYKELDDFGYARHSMKDDDFDGHQGESPNQVATRMSEAVSTLINNHPEENLIIVSHGGAIAHLIARLIGTKPAFGPKYIMHNAAFSEIRLVPHGPPELVTLNHHDHLPEHLKTDPRKRRDHNAADK